MKVKEFIELFDRLGYDENTDLMCGAYDLNGDWYEFNFEVEDDDRKLNPNDNGIAVTLEPSEDYIDSRLRSRYDVDVVMKRIYDDVYYILTHDE